MIANILIVMSVLGLLAAFGDLLLSSEQKKKGNYFVEVIWYKLASVKGNKIVDRARSRWLFIAALVVPVIAEISIAYFEFDLEYALSTLLLMVPSIICASPFMWWMSRSNSIGGLAIRATISGVLLYYITHSLMWLGEKWFVEDTDDLIIWALFAGRALLGTTVFIFSSCVILAVLPVPMAYLGVGVLTILEFIFRKCIENNKGGFIAVCAFIGSLAAFFKLFM